VSAGLQVSTEPPGVLQGLVMAVVALVVLVALVGALRLGARRPRSRRSRWGSWGRKRHGGGGAPEPRPKRKPLLHDVVKQLHERIDGQHAAERERRQRAQNVRRQIERSRRPPS
jgi:hypothetical protein